MAARKFLTPIDMSLLEIRDSIAHLLASAPGGPVEGQIYYNTTTHTFSFYNGTAWVVLGTLDQITAPAADVALNNKKITGLGAPSAGTDAVTKTYADGLISGISSWKSAVRAATTVNGTLATAYENADVIDGVTLATGDRILLKNQTTGGENGIYTVAASGAPTRTTDADAGTELVAAGVWVDEGTTQADSAWVNTTAGPITLGTTATVWTQFSGAGQITSGAGLTKTGNTLDVGAGTGITVAADSVAIDTSVTVDKTTAQTLTTKTLTSPVINTPTGIVKGDVGLGNVDNTSNVTERAATATLTNKTLTSPVINTPTGLVESDIASLVADLAARTKRFSVDCAAATTTVVTHNFGTLDVLCQVYVTGTTGAMVDADIQHTTTNTTTVAFAVAPTAAQYRITCVA